MAIKDISTLRSDIITAIKTAQPNITTRAGSAVRDIFVNPLAYELSYLYNYLDIAKDAQSVNTANDIDLVNLAENFAIYRKEATKANGYVTFSTRTLPVSDITIPAGTIIATRADSNGSSFRFKTVQSVTMYAAYAASYYNSDEAEYQISTIVEAELSGEAYNVAANAINTIVTNITGISNVTNTNDITNGSDEESINSLRNRLLERLSGNNIGSMAGYYNTAMGIDNVLDAVVIGPRDTEMERKSVGAVDVYIKGIVNTQITETKELTSLSTPDIIPTFRPIITTIPGTLISSTFGALTYGINWEWEKDTTSVYRDSYKSLDKIKWLIPLAPIGTLTMTYTYNGLVYNSQVYFDSDEQKNACADVLVKWASPVYVNITTYIKVVAGYDSVVVQNSVDSALTVLLSTYLLGQEVQLSDIIAEINDVVGVDDVDSSRTVISDQESILVIDSYGNLDIPKYKYAVAGTITINLV